MKRERVPYIFSASPSLSMNGGYTLTITGPSSTSKSTTLKKTKQNIQLSQHIRKTQKHNRNTTETQRCHSPTAIPKIHRRILSTVSGSTSIHSFSFACAISDNRLLIFPLAGPSSADRGRVLLLPTDNLRPIVPEPSRATAPRPKPRLSTKLDSDADGPGPVGLPKG